LIKYYISEASNWKFLRVMVMSTFLFVAGTFTWQSCHIQLLKPLHQCHLWLVVNIIWQAESMKG
jgi:hypothetical protein